MTLSKYDNERILKVKDWIDNNLQQPLNILEISKSQGIHINKMQADFKLVTGHTIYNYVRFMRLANAAHLLESTHQTLKEIAKNSGFRHTANFITAYRKQFGMSPTKWREKYQY